MALTQRNHDIIGEYFSHKDTSNLIAIDATCGNGRDTLFLAKLGFKKVYGFDIQQQAIDNTHQLLEQENLNKVSLIKAGHETIDKHVMQKADCIIFNLGYLPNADKNITTTEQTSLKALEKSLSLLNQQGLISILCYPGHTQGAIETKAIQERLEELDENWKITQILSSHPSTKAPILYLIRNSMNE